MGVATHFQLPMEHPLVIAMKFADPNPQEIIARCRVQQPQPTPGWVKEIPKNLKRNALTFLIERHLYKEGKVWGLARGMPEQAAPFDEVGTARFLSALKRYELETQAPGYNEQVKRNALAWWQSWQDPKTGRFHDPDNPKRLVNEKFVVAIIRQLGGELLYPHTTTSSTGKIETAVFLRRTKDDPDWQIGGWGVGSHTGFMAVEIYRTINEQGREDLIPDLEEGMTRILSHQNQDGLFGPPDAPLAGRIGGTLKVIARLYGLMGLIVPYTRELADTLIDKQARGEFHACSTNDCPQLNEASMIGYCLEVSEYRRGELHAALASVAEDLRAWVNDDGSVSHNRGQLGGLQSLVTSALSTCSAYLNWQGCPFGNSPVCGECGWVGDQYRAGLTPEERVKVIKRW